MEIIKSDGMRLEECGIHFFPLPIRDSLLSNYTAASLLERLSYEEKKKKKRKREKEGEGKAVSLVGVLVTSR